MVLIEQVLFDFAYHDYWRYKFVLDNHLWTGKIQVEIIICGQDLDNLCNFAFLIDFFLSFSSTFTLFNYMYKAC